MSLNVVVVDDLEIDAIEVKALDLDDVFEELDALSEVLGHLKMDEN